MILYETNKTLKWNVHVSPCFHALWHLVSQNHFSQKNDWIQLFNGKDLSGWDTYLAPPLDDAGKKLSDIPVGLNNDPNHVFSIVNEGVEKLSAFQDRNGEESQL